MKSTLRFWFRLAWCGVLGVLAGGACAQVPSNAFDYIRTRTFTYTTIGQVLTQTVEPTNAADCSVVTYGYDALGNQNSVTQASCSGATGAALFTSRGTSGVYAAVASQSITVNGTATTVASAAGIEPTSMENELSQTTTDQFDPRFGVALSVTDPNGIVVATTVDDFGRVASKVYPDGTSKVIFYCVLASSGLNTSSNSSGCPTPASGEVPTGATTFVHSESHNTSNVKMGPFARKYMDRLGRVIRTVTESFDGTSQPSGVSGVSLVIDVVYLQYGPKQITSQPYFLATGSSTTTGSNNAGAVMNVYDDLGRVVTRYVADPNASTSQTFGGTTAGSYGSYGSQHASTTTYTYNGTTKTVTNDHSQVQTYEHDLLGQLTRVTDASGAQIAYQHDAFGNVVQIVDALQNQTTAEFDYLGFMVQSQDPDRGLLTTTHDPLGNIVSTQNPTERAASHQTTYSYDVRNRLVQRVEPEFTSNWYFDAYNGGTSCTAGIGRLCEVVTTSGIDRKYVFDSYGRPLNDVLSVTSGPGMAEAVGYDAPTGRITSKTFPTGLQIGYSYTSRGYLQAITLLTASTVTPLPSTPGGTPVGGTTLPSGTVLWQPQVIDAFMKTEKDAFSNGVVDTTTWEAATGRELAVTAGLSGGTTVANQQYTWDTLSNLTARVDENGSGTGAVTETFTYGDNSNNALNINRLTQYTVSGPSIPGLARYVNLQYNAVGMLIGKDDVGNYVYPSSGSGSVRPHAVSSVYGSSVTTTYSDDANGNVTGASGGKYGTIEYTSFNLPDSQVGVEGPSDSPDYTWQYDASHARLKEVRSIPGTAANSGTRTVWYFNPDQVNGLSFESEVDNPNTPSTQYPAGTQNRHFLMAGQSVVGVLVTSGTLPTLSVGQTAPTPLSSATLIKVEYWHKDFHSSLLATTDHAGNITATYSFDPFGKRRYTSGVYDASGAIDVDWNPAINNGTARGFTGYEHLDDIGLIHANGRLYDPTLGLFIQADPDVSNPRSTQAYNRYAYVNNNPFRHSDPSGLDSQVDAGGCLLCNTAGGSPLTVINNPSGFTSGPAEGGGGGGGGGQGSKGPSTGSAPVNSDGSPTTNALPANTPATPAVPASETTQGVDGNQSDVNGQQQQAGYGGQESSGTPAEGVETPHSIPTPNVAPIPLPGFIIVNGTGVEQEDFQSALNIIGATQRGAYLLDTATANGLIISLVPSAAPNGQAVAAIWGSGGGSIYVAPDFPGSADSVVETTQGPQPSSLDSILAHELGHVVTNTLDDGPGQMNNINLNENPVRQELMYPARTEYSN